MLIAAVASAALSSSMPVALPPRFPMPETASGLVAPLYDPSNPPLTERGPYLGEAMLRPIESAHVAAAGTPFPPGAFALASTAAAATAAPTAMQGGPASYEVSGAPCTGFYDPKTPPSKETEPYRGEDMLKPINQTGTAGGAINFPPTVDQALLPTGFRVTATAELEVSPNGTVVRARATSPEDGRFAAHAVSVMRFGATSPWQQHSCAAN